MIIRSTFIVGFPGETEEEFEELLAFLQEAQIDRVGCFKYSPVEGATANALPDHIPEEVKEDRLQRFMEVQSQISAERLKTRIGKEYQIVIDEVTSEGAVGRCYADAPEVDGVVHLKMKYARFFPGLKEDSRVKGYARLENAFLGYHFNFILIL